jgi:hypothetical protein
VKKLSSHSEGERRARRIDLPQRRREHRVTEILELGSDDGSAASNNHG